LGAKVVYDPAEGVKKEGENFSVYTTSHQKYSAKCLILATGTERRKLQIPGEDQFLGKGVSYCTTCDAPFYREKTVAMVGGSDAAVSGAIHTAEFAQKVYIIYRKEALRAEPIWIEQVLGNPKIQPIYNTNVTEIKGEQTVKSIVLDQPFEGKNELPVDGVFIQIGSVPGTELAKLIGVELNEGGYIKVDKQMKTNIEGVFAAGDLTDFLPSFQQLVTVEAMGALAAASAFQFVKHQSAPPQRGV
jgi:thioredoxin reductase (NADPH)